MLGQLITVIHVFICCFLILIVLLQQGRGADAGATFGGGGQTFFGASGADTLLTKVTTFTAILFMCTSIMLASNIRSVSVNEGELMQMLETKPASVSVTESANEAAQTGASEEAAQNEPNSLENGQSEDSGVVAQPTGAQPIAEAQTTSEEAATAIPAEEVVPTEAKQNEASVAEVAP